MKVVTEVLLKTLKGENVKKLHDFLEEYQTLEKTEEKINSTSKFIKKHTYKSYFKTCVMDLDLTKLEEIIQKYKKEDACFVALLELGRNANDELEFFMQYLDKDKGAMNAEDVYCLSSHKRSSEVKEAFGKKNMLLINL